MRFSAQIRFKFSTEHLEQLTVQILLYLLLLSTPIFVLLHWRVEEASLVSPWIFQHIMRERKASSFPTREANSPLTPASKYDQCCSDSKAGASWNDDNINLGSWILTWDIYYPNGPSTAPAWQNSYSKVKTISKKDGSESQGMFQISSPVLRHTELVLNVKHDST